MQTPFADLPKKIKMVAQANILPRERQAKKLPIELSDENIQNIFGHEAAEDESIESLKDYYFRTDIYEQVAANLKLRILVGHKGVGKSALFKILVNNDIENEILPIEIKPDDVIEICNMEDNFLKMIREWKDGIKKIIVDKTLQSLIMNMENKNIWKKNENIKNIISFIADIIKPYAEKSDINKSTYENFMSNKRLNIYIDDLDRGWKGTHKDIYRLSSLLNAIRDISNENNNINFKIALRSDVYYLVRTSDESTDKIEGSVVWFTWTNHQILAVLAKRILTFQGKYKSESDLLNLHQDNIARFLYPIIAERFEGRGKWENAPIHRILMSLVRKRPRDLVKLCTLAAKNARRRHSLIIETEDFQNIFETYSTDRVQDTVNEFRSELPEIKNLLFSLKPSAKKAKKYSEGYVYETEKLLEKLSIISRRECFSFTNAPDEVASPQKLLAFLYKIGFITARKENKEGKIIRKTFEENKYLSDPQMDFSFKWEVHPAYRWALEPDDFNAIYDKLDIAIEWE